MATACDPEAEYLEESSEALVAESADPDQIVSEETPQTAPPQDNKCRKGFKQAGGRLCIDPGIRQPEPYLKAAMECRDSNARVCTVEDFAYLYHNTNMDAHYNPKEGWKQRWLGNYVGDNEVLCGDRSITSNNDPDQTDFDGECSAKKKHAFWCCHDPRNGKGKGGDDDGGWDDDDGGWDDDDGGWDDDGHDGGWDDDDDGGWGGKK